MLARLATAALALCLCVRGALSLVISDAPPRGLVELEMAAGLRPTTLNASAQPDVSSEYLRNLATAKLPLAAEPPFVGDRAPDFNLTRKSGTGTYRLSDFYHKRPVILIFGSYT